MQELRCRYLERKMRAALRRLPVSADALFECIRLTNYTVDGLVSLHRVFDHLRSGRRRIGSNSGATNTSMLRATPGCRRISPVRSRVSTIW